MSTKLGVDRNRFSLSFIFSEHVRCSKFNHIDKLLIKKIQASTKLENCPYYGFMSWMSLLCPILCPSLAIFPKINCTAKPIIVLGTAFEMLRAFSVDNTLCISLPRAMIG